jgi:hypothetical protein
MVSEEVAHASAGVILNSCFAMNAADVKTTQAEARAADDK